MSGVLGRLRRWWEAPAATVPAGYAVTCTCGEVVRGTRLPRPQIVPCPACSAELFILPLSPLPPVTGSAAPAAVPSPRWRLWALPVVAALVTAAGLFIVYLVVFRAQPEDPARNPGMAAPPLDPAERLEAVRRLMHLGHFRLAAEELTALDEQARTRPEGWSPAQLRQRRQLAGQAALIADLISEPLETVLRHAAEIQEREWRAVFRHRYRGKGVAFDMEVRALGEGRYEHDYRLEIRGERAHLDLSDLELLHRLPADRPARLLFGGRLAGVAREPGRGWVVRLEADSGVLITDPGAARACFVAPEDPEVAEVLSRQAAWAERDAP